MRLKFQSLPQEASPMVGAWSLRWFSGHMQSKSVPVLSVPKNLEHMLPTSRLYLIAMRKAPWGRNVFPDVQHEALKIDLLKNSNRAKLIHCRSLHKMPSPKIFGRLPQKRIILNLCLYGQGNRRAV